MKSPILALTRELLETQYWPVYKGVTIPISRDYAPKTIPTVTDGSSKVQVYIVLLNATANDDSPKCHRNDQVSIQVQVNTIWPQNTGRMSMADEIAEAFLAKVFPTNDLNSELVVPGFHLWKSTVESIRPISYDNESSRQFVNQIILSCKMSQS